MDSFRIDITTDQLTDLTDRLGRTRWPDEIPGAGWDYGVPIDYVRELAEYWRTTYDWRAQQDRLNQYPQYVVELRGQRVHFVHVESPEPDAFPLVMTHGWPGSFVEFLEVIGPLTDPRSYGGDPADAFHLVLPGLPGFGLSEPSKPGLATMEYNAELIAELMARLGYDRYGAQGGDAGSLVSPELGRIDREHVAGVHTNGLITVPGWDEDASGYSASDQEKVAALNDWSSEKGGYAMIQGTRPQTLAVGLTDSPAGQLAWITDIFRMYTDPSIELPDDAVDRDQLLTDISLYWFTAAAGSSARIYKESTQWGEELSNSGVPTACAVFPGDTTVRAIAERQNTVVRWTEFDRGGHFAAMEAPDLLVDDIRAFFRTLR